jgi:hypothetical protein
MSDATTVDTEAPSATGAPPPAVRLPKPVQMVLMAGFRRWFLQNAVKRYGSVFAINVPFFGRSVVISDPALARKVFLASTDDLINVEPQPVKSTCQFVRSSMVASSRMAMSGTGGSIAKLIVPWSSITVVDHSVENLRWIAK